ncbi:hypothetical protein MKW98_010779, partial [Papaver atlanticum]
EKSKKVAKIVADCSIIICSLSTYLSIFLRLYLRKMNYKFLLETLNVRSLQLKVDKANMI